MDFKATAQCRVLIAHFEDYFVAALYSNDSAKIMQFHYAALHNSLQNSLQVFAIKQRNHDYFTQLFYAEILKITRLHSGGHCAEILQNYAMGNLLMLL